MAKFGAFTSWKGHKGHIGAQGAQEGHRLLKVMNYNGSERVQKLFFLHEHPVKFDYTVSLKIFCQLSRE